MFCRINDAMYDEGKRAGEHDNQVKVAKKMLELGSEPSFVQKVTDLSLKEIEEIKKSDMQKKDE